MVQKSLIVKALKSPNKVFHQGQRFFKDNLKDFIIIVTQQDILSEIVNQKEIRVVGMRRTGNHAIINWIKGQQTGKIEFWNDLKVNINALRQKYENLRENYPFVKKDCLIRSYEDYTLQEITNWIFESKHDLYFGKSGTRYEVLILRDPFNLFASRLKNRLQKEKNNLYLGESSYGNNFLSVRNPNKTVADLWINYAKEYLGETNYLKQNKICINYNQWFTDVEYRRNIADKLQMEFSDVGINKVAGQGGGSSFEGKEFDGKATSMDVLNRWQKVADNPRYRELFNNQKILKYSERIFGHIPGTESLIN
ncbi:MAG: hypothetical protein F6K48_19295 [Okeania sp. SIO3H1]|uniref:hypothetical protein n=1 Tax=Okeania sp. SIO1I7 TaxID=2607772 RepID=UPI0013CC92C8|nr:hypothetical protein [Okeania sp. SIO1I7]NEN90938.1 hypothetical protein [Okeania sp. SIO3H1]NET28445.1 hypothetical protein [Okeania sp. SIO1I7]